jgi:beta-lactamase regulating signal transducer with metallopeptidase domain
MTIGSFLIFKSFKTHRCQQHELDLTKIVAHSKKNEKKSHIVVHDVYK